MTDTKVLISGAGVAGAALAHFLHHDGFDVTVVERAPACATAATRWTSAAPHSTS